MNRNIYVPRKIAAQRPKPIHHQRHLLKHFIHTVPVPICIIDRLSGLYLEGNQPYADLLGLKREKILQHHDSELPANLGANNLSKILNRLESERMVRSQDLFIYDLAGKLVKSSVRAELVDFDGREAVMMTFTLVGSASIRPAAGQSDINLLAAIEISRELSETCGGDEIIRQLAESTGQLLPDISTLLISHYDAVNQHVSIVFARHDGALLNLSNLPEYRLDLTAHDIQSEAVLNHQPVIAESLDGWMQSTAARMNISTPGKIIQSAICVPMMAGCEVMGTLQAYSYKAARFHQTEASLLSLICNAAAGAIQTGALSSSLEHTSQVLTQTYDATIDGWSRALELRDFSTERHTQRVVSMTMELGKRMGLDDADLMRMKHGAQLHDIGKMGIPDTILLKPGPLSDAEWQVMRKHPVYAYELLRPIPKFNEIVDIPYCHHEKWDGSGYPRRLRGSEIPITARIFSIVDVWDALSSNRPYRNAWPQHQVLDYITYQSNKHFEPEITRAFLEIVKGKSNQKPAASIFRRPAGSAYSNSN